MALFGSKGGKQAAPPPPPAAAPPPPTPAQATQILSQRGTLGGRPTAENVRNIGGARGLSTVNLSRALKQLTGQ